MRKLCGLPLVPLLLIALFGAAQGLRGQEPWRFIFPEQRHIEVRDPSQLPRARLPELPAPATVSEPRQEVVERGITLDEAIRIALDNSKSIRVLAGETAAVSGQTIYDPAIANTLIDQSRGRFDPRLDVTNQFSRSDTPFAFSRSGNPNDVRIGGIRRDDYNMNLALSKTMVTGGTASLGVNTNPFRTSAPTLLNPQTANSVELALTQPLLQGAGPQANLAPIVVARLDTERSFFQMKDSVQQMVLGVIDAYWALVFARTDVWARQQQVDQGLEAYRRAEARLNVGLGNAAEVAQARSSLAGFRANLIGSQASLLQREAALRNMLGWPPSDAPRLVPMTPPMDQRWNGDWNRLLQLAEQRRPDLVELKLVLEADQQQLLIARNQALPQLNANAIYRWNGLEGRTPDRRIVSDSGQFNDWQLGVNFSVPLGLRSSRANLRQRELVILRDRATLDEQLLDDSHLVATSYRRLAQFFEQYLAYRETRDAAWENLNRQLADYLSGRPTIYLNVLQSITEWGNAVSLEAQALTQYNSELARMELETGTILETHGVRFAEERYGSIGPLGRAFADRCYPKDMRPCPNQDRYQNSNQPAEQAFGLQQPVLPEVQPVPPSPEKQPLKERLRIDVPEQVPAPQ